MNLILHIGAGKTGTTSIQDVLLNNNDLLIKQGYRYLGLMLENAYTTEYLWQRKTTVNTDFFNQPFEKAFEELYAVLSDTIQKAKKDNIHTLIWSNESFFDTNNYIISVIHKLQSEGLNVKLIAYIRRHESWTKSAYSQWGIKHKTYPGKLKTFHEWIQHNVPNFSKKLEPFIESFPNQLTLKNMDAIKNKDVVEDFLAFTGVGTKGMRSTTSNVTPKNEELLLRALFNSKYNTQVLPQRFDNMFEYFNPTTDTPESFLTKLLPSSKDLQYIQEQSQEDREQLNRYFREQSQPPIETGDIASKPIEIDKDRLLMILSNLLMGQSRRIDKLEKRIEEIEKKTDHEA